MKKSNTKELLTTLLFTTALVAIPLIVKSKEETTGTVKSVGKKGIAVEYENDYGEPETARIKMEDTSLVSVGDTACIEIISNGYGKTFSLLSASSGRTDCVPPEDDGMSIFPNERIDP